VQRFIEAWSLQMRPELRMINGAVLDAHRELGRIK
jgi:hypothetical protein